VTKDFVRWVHNYTVIQNENAVDMITTVKYLLNDTYTLNTN